MSEVDFKSLAKEMSGKQKSSSSILLLSIITLVAVIMLWAATTELDNVTRGAGKTISEAQNQLVQSSEPGVLRRRYFNEGDFVSKGAVLFDIDPVDAKTQLDQAQKRLSSLRIRSTRLKAEIDGTVPNYASDLIEAAPSSVSRAASSHDWMISCYAEILEQHQNTKAKFKVKNEISNAQMVLIDKTPDKQSNHW